MKFYFSKELIVFMFRDTFIFSTFYLIFLKYIICETKAVINDIGFRVSNQKQVIEIINILQNFFQCNKIFKVYRDCEKRIFSKILLLSS